MAAVAGHRRILITGAKVATDDKETVVEGGERVPDDWPAGS